MNDYMVAVDFFCGAGGLTRGLLNAGISVRLGIDSDDRCLRTYEANNPGVRFLCGDVREVEPSNIATYLGDVPAERVLFGACAPCQPFSNQRGANHNSDDRTLLGAFARFVAAFLPGQVFIENVPGLRRKPGFSTYRRFCKALRELGYEWDEGVLDGKYYGVPQTRRRYVMVAMRGMKPALPLPTHGPDRLAYRTVRDAISHYPPLRAGETHPLVPNHRAAALSSLNLMRMQHTPPDGGDRRSWSTELELACHSNGHTGHTDVYGRMWWDRPAPALTSRCDSLSNGRYGHPEQDRAISLREAASLQSFPDSYVFDGPSKAHIATQIGNAVPVALAEVIARHILVLRGVLEIR